MKNNSDGLKKAPLFFRQFNGLIVVFSALLLVCAGMVMAGCAPSDVEPPVIVSDPDIIHEGGNYKHYFETPMVEQGKTYTVKFMITACDSDFPGSTMGGKLCYKSRDDSGNTAESILSGWDWCVPGVVIGPGVYKWTFKAGEKNHDDKPIASPATTPETGAEQYFLLVVQDSGQHVYPDYYRWNFKGYITVVEKEMPPAGTTLQKTVELQRTYGGSGHDSSKGIGNLEGEEFDKVKNAGPSAVLRFFVTDCDVDQQKRDEGWGVASAGNLVGLSDDANPNAIVKIPSNASISTSSSFEVDVPVEDALDCVKPEESHLFINVWNGKVLKLELWEYK
ncbi:MAG: hypothetical protein LBB72_03640 [Spirochaetaceae bacterium]|nr:hypothetical protein [Spirochaetaceae bacterium]